MSRGRPEAAPAAPAAGGGADAAGGPRARILEAAARSISEHGFHGMSMRELAREAGMSLGNTYNYFSSKEEILFAIQRGAFEVLAASAAEAVSEVTDPRARLYVFISHHVRYVAEHPAVMRVLVHEAATLPPEHRREVRRLKERYFELGRSIVAELVAAGCEAGDGGPGGLRQTDAPTPDPGELDRMTYGVFGMLNWIYGWYEPRLHGSPADVARSIHRVALCGVSPHCPFRDTRDLQDSLDRHLDSVATPHLLAPLPTGAGGAAGGGEPPRSEPTIGGRVR